ncbi:MAG: hypothetical protein MR902_07650 [Campylobacter sp.]|nr:hypothetical protein [Campylobacter sp.]
MIKIDNGEVDINGSLKDIFIDMSDLFAILILKIEGVEEKLKTAFEKDEFWELVKERAEELKGSEVR